MLGSQGFWSSDRTNQPSVKISLQVKIHLKDAAAVNSTRYALLERLKATGLPVEIASGGRTKFNRFERQIPKTHWLDAACVDVSTPEVLRWEAVTPLAIKSMGHGKRQVVGTDKYGFPKGRPKKNPHHSFRTSDVVEAKVPVGKSKYADHHISRIVSTPSERPRVVIKYKGNGKNFPCALTYVTGKLFTADGYDYGFLKAPVPRVLAN